MVVAAAVAVAAQAEEAMDEVVGRAAVVVVVAVAVDESGTSLHPTSTRICASSVGAMSRRVHVFIALSARAPYFAFDVLQLATPTHRTTQSTRIGSTSIVTTGCSTTTGT